MFLSILYILNFCPFGEGDVAAPIHLLDGNQRCTADKLSRASKAFQLLCHTV